MEESFFKIAGTFGIPVVILVALGVAFWRICRFAATDVVKPLTTATIEFMKVQQKVAVSQRKLSLRMANVLGKVSTNLEAIHIDQLKLLEQYRIKGTSNDPLS